MHELEQGFCIKIRIPVSLQYLERIYFLNIGIFGGTFNPVHFGHLRTVEDVREKFNLDIVYFVLAKIPPHKLKENVISAKERYKILKLALKGNPFFKLSNIELKRKKPSYSLDTIKYFKKKFQNDNLFFILGSDAFNEIDTWYKFSEILNIIDIIVMTREEFHCNESFMKKLGYKSKKDYFINKNDRKVYFQSVTRLYISSSKIRKYISQNLSINYFLPEKCISYIYQKKLYTSEHQFDV